jgi:hypothetical protein
MILKNMLSISTQIEREKKVVDEENYKEFFFKMPIHAHTQKKEHKMDIK